MRLPFFVWTQFVTAFLLLPRLPAPRGGGADAADGPGRRLEPLLSRRPRRRRHRLARQRRRHAPPLAAPLLVPRAIPRSTCSSSPASASSPRSFPTTPQAALGLQADGLRPPRPRLPLHDRLGPPHVPDRHGHGGQLLLPAHHQSSSRCRPSWSSARSSFRSGAAPSASPSPMLWATAFLPLFGIGGLTGIPLAFNAPDTLPARLLLHHRPLPLRHRAGHHLRLLRRDHLLVPEGDRPGDERVLEQGPLLGRR